MKKFAEEMTDEEKQRSEKLENEFENPLGEMASS
jgi:hypothetical protein